jgi:hypothetical protein
MSWRVVDAACLQLRTPRELLGPDGEVADATELQHRFAALVDAIRTRAA